MNKLNGVLFIAALLIGCTSVEAPQTLNEQIAYAEAGAQGAMKSIADLTCTQYEGALCAVPNRPLAPADAKKYVQAISTARVGLKAAASMPASGGACLGDVQSPTDCLRAAQAILTEVENILLKATQK